MTVKELRDLLARATKGPWFADDAISGDGSVVMSEAIGFRVAHLPETRNVTSHEADAEAIVALRNSADAMLDVVEAVQRFHTDETCVYDRAEDCPLCVALAKLEGAGK